MRGHGETIGQRLQRDLEAMAELPATPFDACDQTSGRVSSQALVRYKTNDYSVPVAYGHRDVWLRGYVDQVVIGCGGEIIARHPRCYDREDMVFDPVHYLPLLEKKITALDQAAPLAKWDLPPEFQTLRRLMEARMIKAGRREYVQVLRLLETFDLGDLHVAVKTALRMGTIGFDAIKHLVLCQVEKRPPKLDLDVYPYLPSVQHHAGQGTAAASYMRRCDAWAPRACAHGLQAQPQPVVAALEAVIGHQLQDAGSCQPSSGNTTSWRASALPSAAGHVRFLARLVELELIDRERRMIERRIKAAKFPAVKSLPASGLAQAHPDAGAARITSSNFNQSQSLYKMLRADALASLRMAWTGVLEPDRSPWSKRHRQDTRCSGSRPRRLSEGPLRGLHHRRSPGP